MKIGILTFHCAHNYGAVLQCYATQEFLRSKGYDVEIINYRPEYLLRPYKLFDKTRFKANNPIQFIKKIIIELMIFKMRYKRRKGFEKFINNRLSVGCVVTKNTLPSDCNAYIIGSDQVWNPRITRGFDSIYFANFPFEKEEKKYISYAASMETKSLDETQIEFYKKNLSNFDALSVRENVLLQLLQPLTSKNITHVLDPTLMAPSHIWNNFSSDKSVIEKYVVVYQIRGNPNNTLRIANQIANQIGAKVKVLIAWLQHNPVKNTNQVATPEEFVNTIRNAACVVTTSFHGTAFSVVFNRPFYTVKLNDGADSRSTSLLYSLGLENRLIEINESPTFTEIDYSIANQKLDKLRKESQDFLLNNL